MRFRRCDQNISVRADTTTCRFGENAFYAYWTSEQGSSIRVYSPTTKATYDTSCRHSAANIVCTTADRGAVRFSQAAVDAYTQDEADAYAASADLGPAGDASSDGTASPSSTAIPSSPDDSPPPDDSTPSPDSGFCATHDCIPNYPNGNGTTVQCQDGTYSHSGGIQGACSHHGGVG